MYLYKPTDAYCTTSVSIDDEGFHVNSSTVAVPVGFLTAPAGSTVSADPLPRGQSKFIEGAPEGIEEMLKDGRAISLYTQEQMDKVTHMSAMSAMCYLVEAINDDPTLGKVKKRIRKLLAATVKDEPCGLEMHEQALRMAQQLGDGKPAEQVEVHTNGEPHTHSASPSAAAFVQDNMSEIIDQILAGASVDQIMENLGLPDGEKKPFRDVFVQPTKPYEG